MRKKYKGMGVQEDINKVGIFMLLKSPLLILSTLLVATTFFIILLSMLHPLYCYSFLQFMVAWSTV